MIEAISDLPTLILLVLLIAAFVVAFKLLEMIFETIMVSVLSGAFYIGMVYLFDFPLTVDRVLLYAFLGSTLYMVYSFLASAYTIFSKLIGIPFQILNALFRYSTSALGKHKEENLKKKAKSYSERIELFADKLEAKAQRTKIEQQKEEERDVKEVVLNKVKEDKDDEETD